MRKALRYVVLCVVLVCSLLYIGPKCSLLRPISREVISATPELEAHIQETTQLMRVFGLALERHSSSLTKDTWTNGRIVYTFSAEGIPGKFSFWENGRCIAYDDHGEVRDNQDMDLFEPLSTLPRFLTELANIYRLKKDAVSISVDKRAYGVPMYEVECDTVKFALVYRGKTISHISFENRRKE